MTDRLIYDLCAELQPLAQQFLDNCKAAGIYAFLTETFRSCADQDNDYAQGRTATGNIITNAKGGQSPHNCMNPDGNPAARAFDFAIQDSTGILNWDASDSEWQSAIKIGEALGLVSGSNFHSPKDFPHLELLNWQQK